MLSPRPAPANRRVSESSPFILKLETEVSNIPTPMGPAKGLITNAVTAYTVNEPITDDVFAFVAPDGVKKVDEFSVGARPAPNAVEAMLGPTGNLRAPTIRRGKTVVVGFNEEAYERIFG